ncbi:peptidoglycan DD-metalloendopeptidase family protein [Paenibacillus sp. HN-1]|uniref:peptidoglycan DD-metalloendopeptidase family protein n=1 Tax=Paenibacillus TaxID=44249 RepID=UPI001CA8B945|nr:MULTISPECIES: peptidoglycan DD-metalloendopeptidase family protein [Paenibacillus]MBY9079384.1 peptidoglycan DD-metalloendopeptidase family protein [Paenibacillus sp. CGMCC 1.18879]MBY9085679.1 peptidoglycan DD-metalloendopeptidase family protein [Paenibacillus sinensis]
MGYKARDEKDRKDIRDWRGHNRDTTGESFFKAPGSPGIEDWRKRVAGENGEPDPEKAWKTRKMDWEDEGNLNKPRFWQGLMRRMIASALLFGVVWGVFLIKQPWAYRVQDVVADALNKDMNFASVRTWYDRYFDGAPAFIPMFENGEQPARKVTAAGRLTAPLTGSIVRPFAVSLKGIEVVPSSETGPGVTVKSIDIGRVLSVTKETGGGIRVAIQHTGGLTAEYGHLSGTKLKANDWLESGDTVGWLQEPAGASANLLYFSLMKDKKYVDPTEEITFD